MFPDIRTLRMDGDTTRRKGSHEKLFKQFRSGKADVLIGTQMIAKGLHFPSVTLVGILGSDGALSIPDFRAHETVFGLLTQVSGRSGRCGLHGEVIIQTRMPDHPIYALAAKEDYIGFYQREIEGRKLFSYPPFSHLIKLLISGLDEKETFSFGKTFRDAVITQLPAQYSITPLVPCGTAKIKDRYRFQCFIKGKSPLAAARLLGNLHQETKRPKGVSVHIDVDPRSTY